MLAKIHSSHMGADSNYRLCRDIVFWPGMRSAIKDTCSSCGKCAAYGQEQPRESMLSTPIPEYPWQFVSQDLFKFERSNFLITVDHYSDYIEVDLLENTLSSTVIAKSKATFCRYGIPEVNLTDNGPQFTSMEYAVFCKEYGTQDITSSPYYTQGNGKAEAAVKVVKSLMKKADDYHLPYYIIVTLRLKVILLVQFSVVSADKHGIYCQQLKLQ